MIRTLVMLLPLQLALAAAPALANEKPDAVLSAHAGVRAAYALPFGVFTGEGDPLYLYNIYLGTVPLWVDLEMAIHSKFRMGLFAQYAPGHVRGGCDSSCTASDLGVGLQVSYHFKPRKRMDPWVGLGIGYEWTNLDIPGFSMSYQGPALHLQAGGDYGIAGPMRIGPLG